MVSPASSQPDTSLPLAAEPHPSPSSPCPGASLAEGTTPLLETTPLACLPTTAETPVLSEGEDPATIPAQTSGHPSESEPLQTPLPSATKMSVYTAVSTSTPPQPQLQTGGMKEGRTWRCDVGHVVDFQESTPAEMRSDVVGPAESEVRSSRVDARILPERPADLTEGPTSFHPNSCRLLRARRRSQARLEVGSESPCERRGVGAGVESRDVGRLGMTTLVCKALPCLLPLTTHTTASHMTEVEPVPPVDRAEVQAQVRAAVETYLALPYLQSDGGFLASQMNPQMFVPLTVVAQVSGTIAHPDPQPAPSPSPCLHPHPNPLRPS